MWAVRGGSAGLRFTVIPVSSKAGHLISKACWGQEVKKVVDGGTFVLELTGQIEQIEDLNISSNLDRSS